MTKRDFELIASVISRLDFYTQDGADDRVRVAQKFADALASTNPRFKFGTFLEACGVKL